MRPNIATQAPGACHEGPGVQMPNCFQQSLILTGSPGGSVSVLNGDFHSAAPDDREDFWEACHQVQLSELGLSPVSPGASQPGLDWASPGAPGPLCGAPRPGRRRVPRADTCAVEAPTGRGSAGLRGGQRPRGPRWG